LNNITERSALAHVVFRLLPEELISGE
jgi:hypothetical protein